MLTCPPIDLDCDLLIGGPGDRFTYSPTVEGVTATWDANGDEQTFGRFVSGIPLVNTFAVTVDDPDGTETIDHVTFTLGHLDPVTDSDPADGWTADFDMGQLFGDTTLTVVGYDQDGYASEPWSGTVHVVPFPTWLGEPDDDDRFEDEHYHLGGFFPDELDLSHTIPQDWWTIGGKSSQFRLGVDLGLVAPLDARYDLPIEHEFVFELKILDHEVFGYNSDPLKFDLTDGVTLSFSGLADGDDLSLAGLSGSLVVSEWSPFPDDALSVPEVSRTIFVPVGPVPIPITVALGMNFGIALDAELNLGLDLADRKIKVLPGTYLEPSVSAEPYIFGGLGVDWLNIGVEAGGELGLRYRGLYNSVDGYSDYAWGTFQINLRAVATAGEKHTLATWTVPSGGPWTFGNVPPSGEGPMGEGDGHVVVLPWPNVAADGAGNVLLTRVVDADAAASQADPEIAYAMRDSSGTWSALNPVATNGLIESAPDAAFDGVGGAVVAWVANTIDPALVDTTDWGAYLQTQEIHSSYWDGTSWSAPQAVTSDAVMDGNPQIAFHNGDGLMVWEDAADTGSMDFGGFEVYYALWDKTAHTWGAPARLTNDNAGDWTPTVAFGPTGEAMAVWTHDSDGDPTTAALHYATWDGSSWSALAAVPLGSTHGVREPRIRHTSAGDVLLAWVGNEGGADILYTSVWDHTTASWAAPEAIPETPGLIEGLDLDISDSDEAVLVWHGWDGQSDLFATSRSLTTSDPWAPPVRITESVDGEWMASTMFDSTGTAVTVWANQAVTTVFGEGADGVDVALVPNLAARDVEVTALAHVEGQESRLTVDVANIGLASAAATTAEFYLGDPEAGGARIGEPISVAGLAPGNSASVAGDIFTLPADTNDYYVVVTPDSHEMLTDDNTAHTSVESIPPDVTGPQVTVDLPSDGNVPLGHNVLTLSFDEPLMNLTETDISLVEGTLGIRPPDHFYRATDRTSATLVFEGGLREGSYTLTVVDSVTDAVANALDGDADGSPGGDFVATFQIENHPPSVANPIPDQPAEENQPFGFTFTADTFHDADAVDILSFSAALTDGSSLPTWLSFDAATRTFSGIPRLGDNGAVDVKVTATDTGGLSVDAGFTITVAPDPNPWQNPGQDADDRMDVDDNGAVAPLDVLTIINYINQNGAGDLSAPAAPSDVQHLYIDVNGDNDCTALDVLDLINFINSRAAGTGEGEAAQFQPPAFVVVQSWPPSIPAIPSPPGLARYFTSTAVEATIQRAGSAEEVIPLLLPDERSIRDMSGGAEGSQDAIARSVWDYDALNDLDAAFADLDTVLPDIADQIERLWNKR